MIGSLASRMQSLMAAALANRGGPDFSYDVVKSTLNEYTRAIESACSKDDADAQRYHSILDAWEEGGFSAVFERARFRIQAEALKVQARLFGQMVVVCAKWVLEAHSGVPAGLRDKQRLWDRMSKDVRQLLLQAQGLKEIEDWSGTSAYGYALSTEVQVKAMEELAGVMESTARATGAAARMHAEIFAAADGMLWEAINTINSARGSIGDQYYLRTTTSSQISLQIVGELIKASEWANGASADLNQECDSTIMTVPNLLELGKWPTGTAGATVDPADTANGVTHDGSMEEEGAGFEQNETGAKL